jgi:hypothetical protein
MGSAKIGGVFLIHNATLKEPTTTPANTRPDVRRGAVPGWGQGQVGAEAVGQG